VAKVERDLKVGVERVPQQHEEAVVSLAVEHDEHRAELVAQQPGPLAEGAHEPESRGVGDQARHSDREAEAG